MSDQTGLYQYQLLGSGIWISGPGVAQLEAKSVSEARVICEALNAAHAAGVQDGKNDVRTAMQ